MTRSYLLLYRKTIRQTPIFLKTVAFQRSSCKNARAMGAEEARNRRCCERRGRILYSGERDSGRSPNERCFAFITKDVGGKQGRRTGEERTNTHGPPNTRGQTHSVAVQPLIEKRGCTLPLLALAVIGHREYPTRYSRLL